MVLDDHKQREGIAKCRDAMVENSGVAIGRSQQHGGNIVGSGKKAVSKPLKRKRASIDEHLFLNDRETAIAEYRRELDDLFEFYKELSGCNLKIEDGISRSNNSLIACLLEESSLPYSKLVEELYGKLKARGGFTLASVRSAVLSVGQRLMYGITSADADVLEDDSVSCLWCWETRDLKLLNPTQRGVMNIRRIGRRKIHERISALSETLSALSVPGNGESHKSIIINSSVKLMKTLNGLEIRSLIEKLKQKNGADIAGKVTKQKEKKLIKEMEKNKEKELKKLQEEADKEERRREKETAEEQKLLKKQQEEAERDQRRREKAEADLKKKLSIQKQATLMERFLKTKRNNSSPDNTKKTTSLVNRGYGSPCNVELVSATTLYMDNAFSREDSLNIEDLRKVHVVGWHKLSSNNRSCCWGIRRKPKTELFKELKLQGFSSEAKPLEKVETPKMAVVPYNMDFRREPCSDKLADGSEISFLNDNVDVGSPSIPLLRRKLLQFDKSNRPAYYGTWRKHSDVVGPRHPFKKDPNLDYDVDSDEEWEEEEPGESLSDCDKDTEEERLEDEKLKIDDEEESDDDFIVPDGYLSESEGVQVDNMHKIERDVKISTCCKTEFGGEEIRTVQHQKYLETLTEQALRKGHPLIILNLMHEKSEMPLVEDVNTPRKLEMCLQALRMIACPGGSSVDVSLSHKSIAEQEVPQPQSKSCRTPTPAAAANTSDADLTEFVSSIQSNPQSIGQVVESLQRKFPSTPKSQLRNKVREISDYVDNCWQVKKEISNKLGLSTSPDKGLKVKGIASFFSRCSPSERKPDNHSDSSQQCSKAGGHHSDGSPCP